MRGDSVRVCKRRWSEARILVRGKLRESVTVRKRNRRRTFSFDREFSNMDSFSGDSGPQFQTVDPIALSSIAHTPEF
jgi:hypothetical protein